jgi:hypothetical protein
VDQLDHARSLESVSGQHEVKTVAVQKFSAFSTVAPQKLQVGQPLTPCRKKHARSNASAGKRCIERPSSDASFAEEIKCCGPCQITRVVENGHSILESGFAKSRSVALGNVGALHR